jgi:hypothetical protein
MKPQNDLFELIKSLSKNEKRYFRLFASMQKGSKNYISLFDAIDRQETYDEKKLKISYKSESFTKQMAFTKHYLYNLIIKSLIGFNQKNSPDMKLHSMISECKILFDKALYRKYFRRISEARKFALKHERFGYLMEIIDMEKVIIRKEELQGEKTRQLYSEVNESLKYLRQIFDHSWITSQLLTAYRSQGLTRKKEHDILIDKIVHSAGITLPQKTESYRAKESYYRLLEIKAMARADHATMLKALEKRFKMVNSAPEAFKDLIIDYKNDILYSLIDTSLLLNRPGEAERYLRVLEYSKSNRTAVNNDNNIIISYSKFRIFIKKGELSEAEKMIPHLEQLVSTYKNKILLDIELGIMFQIINCRILARKFPEALLILNKLTLHPFIEKREDFETYLKILNLIIHFELENYSLLKHLIISTYRYLYKREKLFKLEQLIIEFIRKLPEIKNDHDLEFMFGKYTKRLRSLSKDRYERNAFEYFDYLKWIEGKSGASV